MIPTPVLITFLLVAGIIGAAYYLLVLKPEDDEQRALRKTAEDRRHRRGRCRSMRAGLLRTETPLSQIPVVNAMLGATGIISRPAQRLIDRSGLNLTVGALILMCLCAAVAVFLLVQTLSRFVLAAAVMGAVAAYIPIWFVGFKGRVARRQVRGAVSGGDRPAGTGPSRGSRLHDGPVDGRRRVARPGRHGVPAGIRPAELRHADARRAEGPGRARAAARRSFLRHRGPDPARVGRQPVGSAGQPGVGDPRAVQGEAAGARRHRSRAHHRMGAGHAAPGAGGGADAAGARAHEPAVDARNRHQDGRRRVDSAGHRHADHPQAGGRGVPTPWTSNSSSLLR